MISRLVQRVLGPIARKHYVWNAIEVPRAPATVIDVGAAHGTPQLYKAFPQGKLFLVDPVAEYEEGLKGILARREGQYWIGAAGEEAGSLTMNVDLDSFTKSSTYARTELTRHDSHRIEQRTVDVKTLDELAEEFGLTGPFALKVDTEGHELPVIRGARRILKDTLCIIVEASIHRRFEGSYTLYQLLAEMDELGFETGNVLRATPDGEGRVRYADLLFVPKA